MQIDPEEIRRHYVSLSDEALLDVDRSELVPMAQKYYDAEVAARELTHPPEAEIPVGLDDFAATVKRLSESAAMEPNWIETATSAYGFTSYPGGKPADDAEKARWVLEVAGIPCQVKVHEETEPLPSGPQLVYEVMVPAALNGVATGVLERELFNVEKEERFRAYLESLPDEDFRAFTPEVYCAGIIDWIERIGRAHREETARRKLKG